MTVEYGYAIDEMPNEGDRIPRDEIFARQVVLPGRAKPEDA